MGGSVGLILGFLYGSLSIIRYGPGPNGMLRTLGQTMMGSAATFGYVVEGWIVVPSHCSICTDECVCSFFMSIGSTIRTDSDSVITETFRRAQARHGSPVVRSWKGMAERPR